MMWFKGKSVSNLYKIILMFFSFEITLDFALQNV